MKRDQISIKLAFLFQNFDINDKILAFSQKVLKFLLQLKRVFVIKCKK